MLLGMLLTVSALLSFFLAGLNYYGNTIEVLTCNGSICEIRNFAVTDFECLLQLLSYLHRTLASMETDLSFEEPLEDKRLVKLKGLYLRGEIPTASKSKGVYRFYSLMILVFPLPICSLANSNGQD